MSLLFETSKSSSKRSTNRPREQHSFEKTIKAGREIFDAGKTTWELHLALAQAAWEECGPPVPSPRKTAIRNV